MQVVSLYQVGTQLLTLASKVCKMLFSPWWRAEKHRRNHAHLGRDSSFYELLSNTARQLASNCFNSPFYQANDHDRTSNAQDKWSE